MQKSVALFEVCSIIAGQSPPSDTYNTVGNGMPFFQGKTDFGDLYPQIRVFCSNPQKIADKDDILLSVRAPVGPTNLAPCKVCIGRGLAAIRAGEKLKQKYLLYFFRSIEKILSDSGTGTTFKAITQDQIRNLQIPLPPLPEQERIVARIEELFSELDKGVEALQTIKAQLRVYRQAVLKEAFEGFERFQQIKSCSSLVTSGSRGWAQYYSSQGAAFIRIGNLTQDRILIDFSDTQFVQLPDKAEGTRSLLKPSDILISITANLGSIAVVPETIEEAYINQHIAMVRLKHPSLARFYAWYLRSDRGQKDLLRNKRGAGKLGLGLDDIRETHIPIVDDTVAGRIVETIESRLSVCDQIEKTVDESLAKAESLRQSILKKAFEGRL